MLADLRFALRQLKKSPGFAAVAIATLALGIGANTAIFTVVRAVLLDQLPYADPGRLVKIAEGSPDTQRPETVDFTTTDDLRNRSSSFSSMALSRDGSGALVEQANPELLDGMRVSSNYFDTLGVKVFLGRNFLPEEDHPQTRYEVVLTYGLWQRRFGSDPSIVGRTIRLSDRPYKVVGILPANFHPLVRSDRSLLPEMYMPLGYDLKDPSACRGCQHLQLIGRLKPGVSPEQARSELNAILRAVIAEHPSDYDPQTVIAVMPLNDYVVGRVSSALWILLGAVTMVLLIACANVAHLALARAAARSKEMALRAALGAGRARLIRQLLAESLLLAVVGGAVGVVLAYWSTSALAQLGPRQLPRAHEIRVDLPVLLFAAIASIVTGVLFGVVPAFRASQADPGETLKSVGTTSTDGPQRHVYRNVLVTVEITLAFVLLMSAGLMGKSLLQLLNVDPGYDPHNVLTAGVYVYGDRYKQADAELNFYDQGMQRLRATPGIDGAAMVSTLPLASSDRRGFHIKERPLANEAAAPSPDTYAVSPDYFNVMRIPLVHGRVFTNADRAGAPGVALISDSCAKAVFPGEDPIGRHIQLGDRDDKKEWLTIVGIVGNVRQYGFDQPSVMEAYVPMAQNRDFGFNLVVRTAGDPRRFEQTVRQAFLSVDNTQPLDQVRPLEDYVAESQAARRFTLLLLGLFGLSAMVLAAMGIYGVISYVVSLRTRELGIRMALGAARADVVEMVLGQGFRLAAMGLIFGFAASLLLTRFLSSLLYQVHPTDVAVSASVSAVLVLVALLANYIPARRASRVDPMVALRYE